MSRQNFDIVCIAQHSWESAWARPQQLMSRFARNRKVLFVRPISIQHIMTKSYERRRHVFRREKENLYIYSPVVLPWGRNFPPIRKINEFIIKRLVRRKIRGLGLKDFILWLYAPVSEYLVGKLGESKVVYDCTDAWTRFSNAPGYLLEREERLVKKADVLFAGTGMLYEEKKKINPRTHLFTCGVDHEHFSGSSSECIPEGMQNIPSPVIGYCGLIDRERIDLDLLDAIARERRDWSIVLIGPVQDAECYFLDKHPNVYFTGLVDYRELPDYVKRFDVAIIPYAKTEGTAFINPTKLLEYMSAGKPVVSTDLAEIKNSFTGKVFLAGNTAEFSEGISKILDGTITLPVEENLRHASACTWESIHSRMGKLVGAEI